MLPHSFVEYAVHPQEHDLYFQEGQVLSHACLVALQLVEPQQVFVHFHVYVLVFVVTEDADHIEHKFELGALPYA